jgi:hypothetical protein
MTVATTRFGRKMTLRWDVTPNDYIVWLRWNDGFLTKGDLAIKDFWEMREGDLVSITSSIEDLPAWFELHPTEVCGYAACSMMEKKLKTGYKPNEILEGPNLWRAITGDRLVWASGAALPGENPVNALVEFHACALVFGERRIHPNDLVWFMSFGASLEDPLTHDTVERVRKGIDAVRALGHPREMADIGFGWRIGD